MLIRGRYRLVRALGSGGGGTVYEVVDELTGGARVALKALFPTASEQALVSALRAEFSVLASVRHPRLCRVYDFGRLSAGAIEGIERPGYFMTRELVDGTGLAATARAEGRALPELLGFIAQAARGLDVLHSAGIRHGDFKPANTIVGSDGEVRLIDFGLAGDESAQSSAGTLAYMAPELLSRGVVDRRADLYALGISLFELLTGGLPSEQLRGAELARWHLAEPRPSLRAQRPDLPESLDRLASALIARRPEDRMPTAAEVAVALQDCAAELGGEPVTVMASEFVAPVVPMPQVAALERGFERRRWEKGGAALTLLVGERGAGKTTVLTELAWRIELTGAEVLWAGPAHAGPLGVIGHAIEQLATLIGDRPQPAAANESRLASLARIARWLTRASETFPIVILIDDLDSADAATRQLASYLAFALPDRARVALIGACTHTDEAAAGVGTVPAVPISELSRGEVAELLSRASGRRDPQLAARIHRHCAGNLSAVVHTLAAVAARGFPAVEDLDALGLPAQLERAAADAVADASEEQRAVLAALGVVARPASLELVSAILGARSGARLGRDWLSSSSVLSCKLLVRDRAGRLSPSRAGLAASAISALSDDQRAGLHRATADAMIAAGGDSSEPEIVTHLLRAGDPRAVPVGQRAIATLRDAGDLAGALVLGRGLLALIATSAGALDDPKHTLRLATGDLARALGDLEAADELLSVLASEPTAAVQARSARLLLGRSCEEAGHPDRAISLWQGLIEGAPDTQEAAGAARELSRLLIKRGRAGAALEVAEQALARQTGPSPHLEIARLFASAQAAPDRATLDPSAIAEKLERAAGSAGASGDQELASTGYNYAALLSFRAGDYRTTRRRYQLALVAAEMVGDLVRVGTLRMNIASLGFHQGDYGGCLEQHVQAVALLRSARATTPLILARRNLGHLLLELGEYQQARVELRAARRDARRCELELHVAGTTALLGIVDARSASMSQGFAALERAREIFESLGDRSRATETHLDLAEVAVDLGALGRAAAALDKAQSAGAAEAAHGRRARYHALRARVAAARDQGELARRSLDALVEPMDALRAEGARHGLWNLHRLAAHARAELGDTGALSELHAATACAEEIAATLPDGRRAAFWHDPRRRALLALDSTRAGDTALATADRAGPAAEAAATHRLLEIYRRISLEREPTRLLEMAMAGAVELSGAERGFLLLADEKGVLRTAAERNMPAATVRELEQVDADLTRSSVLAIPYSRTIAERAFHDGEVVLSNDPRSDPRLQRAASIHERRLESVVGLPIRREGSVIGVLYLESRFRGAGFGDGDVRTLMSFADQLAILLQNARLIAENARRADELERARSEIEALLGERTALLATRTQELAHARRDLAAVRRRFLIDRGAFGLIGHSPAMERVFEMIERLAATNVPVMILGESGTGKELVARALHEYGPRRDAAMVSINCAALPEELLESELFGHVRGAFTGAERDRPGLFETASGGTLFLDELAEMSARMQASLLRALQEHVVRRVGGLADISVDVRVVCATNRDLEAMVAAGSFRQDLYYRLCVVPIAVPALRNRADDIPLLAEHFSAQACERLGFSRRTIDAEAMRALMAHPWPGNVRQLEHAITNAIVMGEGESLGAAAFENVLAGPGAVRAAPPTDPERRQQREKQRMIDALETCGWNKSKAARLLQIPRRTFYRRLDEYEIR